MHICILGRGLLAQGGNDSILKKNCLGVMVGVGGPKFGLMIRDWKEKKRLWGVPGNS